MGTAELVFADPPFEMFAQDVRDVVWPLSSQFVIAGHGKQYIKLCNLVGFKFWFETVGIRNRPRSLPHWTGPDILHWNTAFLTRGERHCFDKGLCSGYFPSAIKYDDCPQGDYAKPLRWATDILSRYHANTVIDPFSGSGTTLIACEKLGKTFRGMEIQLDKCQLIIERWKANS